MQFLQALAGLALVLAVIAGSAWAMRRLAQSHPGRGSPLALRGALAVGPRERVVVVEVEGTWLVLGVAPGRVQALHALPKGSVPELPAVPAAAAAPAFAALLAKLRR